MTAKTCYDTLGVAADATADEIAAAYMHGLQEIRQSLNAQSPPRPGQLDVLRAAYKQARENAPRPIGDSPIAAPEAPARAANAPPTVYHFEFTGSGGEYFRIWIVNLFLSIITLGIYSAWAKVRRECYVHGNLLLDGAAFAYHGKPVAILKGRALAFGLLVLLSLAKQAGPLPYAMAIVALLPVAPWLIVRAFRFRAHNTSYRGLRFSFHGSYSQALKTFVGYGLLFMLSLGLLFPLFYRQQRKFVFDNLRYGNSQFGCDASVAEFYGIFLKPLGLLIGVIFLVGVFAGTGGGSTALVRLIVSMLSLGLWLFLLPYIRVRSTNLVWNHLMVEGIRFSSTLKVMTYFRLIAGNLILLLLTVGLYWPWAKMRVARYRANCLELLSPAALDGFVAGELVNAPAVGDEVSDMMDMDIAL